MIKKKIVWQPSAAIDVNVKNWLIGVLVKMICRILVHVIMNVIKHEKLVNILILNLFHAENVFLMS